MFVARADPGSVGEADSKSFTLGCGFINANWGEHGIDTRPPLVCLLFRSTFSQFIFSNKTSRYVLFNSLLDIDFKY